MGYIDGLGTNYSMEQCANEVTANRPKATGVIWVEDIYKDKHHSCYATYGNKLTHLSGYESWACLLEGNEISITLFHLTIFHFTPVKLIGI